MSRLVPTFKSSIDFAMLTGASAGSFGAGLNYSLVQDSFGSVRVHVMMDSGVPFNDEFMPVCMQQKWRESFGLNAALPPDCTECRQANGGGLLNLADFLIRKHPNAKLGLITSMQDDVMRLFFSISKDNCAGYDVADPIQNYIAGIFPAAQYEGGVNAVRTRYASTGKLATYYLGGTNNIFHQHTFRPRFFDTAASPSGESIAQWTTKFLNGTITQVGP
jgi:hypothetical protein